MVSHKQHKDHMTEPANPRRLYRDAIHDLQTFGQLTYYPTRDAWGGRGHLTKSVQALVDRGLAWCGPLAAYPTAAGMRYGKGAKA